MTRTTKHQRKPRTKKPNPATALARHLELQAERAAAYSNSKYDPSIIDRLAKAYGERVRHMKLGELDIFLAARLKSLWQELPNEARTLSPASVQHLVTIATMYAEDEMPL